MNALIEIAVIVIVVAAVGAWAFRRVCLIVGRAIADRWGGPRF